MFGGYGIYEYARADDRFQGPDSIGGSDPDHMGLVQKLATAFYPDTLMERFRTDQALRRVSGCMSRVSFF